MFLSFIIPLYNCEKYIARCLDCILACKLKKKNYEVIIVNDGSSDNGPEICQEYAAQYAQIKYVSQENRGASAARNRGIEIARGDFVWFVDADDFITSPILKKVYHCLRNSSIELLCFNHQLEYSDRVVDVCEFKKEMKLSGIEFFEGHYSYFVWNKIYRRTIINDKRFLNGTKNIEDMLFNMKVIIDLKHIHCLPVLGYLYNCTNNFSTSRNTSLRNLVKLDQDSMNIIQELNRFVESQTDYNKQILLKDELNFSITGHLFSLFKFYSPKRLQKRIEDYSKYGLYPVGKSHNKNGNRFLLLANHKRLFVSLMHIGLPFIKNIVKRR